MNSVIPVLDAGSKVLAISAAAILGVVTRTFFNAPFDAARLTSSTSAVFIDLPSNMLGCFVLGLFVIINARFRIPPSVALAVSTGYTGSVTTFASWNYQMTRMLVRGHWLDVIFAFLFGTALPFVFFVVGRDTASAFISLFDRYSPPPQSTSTITEANSAHVTTTLPPSDPYGLDVDPEVDNDNDNDNDHDASSSPLSSTKPLTEDSAPPSIDVPLRRAAVSLPVCALCLIGVGVAAATHESYRERWASAAVAPIGASLRWALALAFNKPRSALPYGTLVANVAACTVDAIVGAVLLHNQSVSRVASTAIVTGFAGSLSTVSTFVSELHTMNASGTRAKIYLYVFASVGAAQIIGVAVYGGAYWAALDRAR